MRDYDEFIDSPKLININTELHMIPVSVVIITKNEAEMISRSIVMLKQLTDDIIIIDNDSTDQTLNIAAESGCRVYQKTWDGYGANKNKGIGLARHNWILSIDADEIPDVALLTSIKELKLDDNNTVYDIPFKAYYGDKPINFGNWGRDHHIRLFNRTRVKWSEPPVHETLQLPQNVRVKKLNGHLHHYSVKNAQEHEAKIIHYAQLSALKYLQSGKKAGFVKLYISPMFHFFKTYIFLLGFLDGKEGWNIARMALKNTWLKYYYLNKAQHLQDKQSYPNKIPVMAYEFKADIHTE
ncbi:glycosyltransferase family 2 protein [Mucilaginibacter pocheonensis]|uniref:Glycosyltransferase involved in cell wall biosynthesis n=1 Tax=Mucilaginibacter pocheonensis TaxID=398050 RepID=A0ABU1TDW2_9SPHI|nr:glycosyltransferase family 2 protein [Mucilaginibacter pocheonensis]MDR6943370.1 glycosyltransferase involved in cell wall biosynthesis [Mucilaginibacter pocheonensis]